MKVICTVCTFWGHKRQNFRRIEMQEKASQREREEKKHNRRAENNRINDVNMK